MDVLTARLRGAWRALGLFATLVACVLHFFLLRPRTLGERSRLRKLWCGRVLRVLKLELHIHGRVPENGVVVGNHLSYLDILTYGAVLDSVFVSKREVKSWPLIGLITRLAGTIYVDRSQRSTSAQVNEEMIAALGQGCSVVFFPEGTSSGGSSVLRFRAALFEAPLSTHSPIWPSAIRYTIAGKDEGVGEQVCYWRDMVFGPHLLRFLCLKDVAADMYFAEKPVHAEDRFEAAQRSQAAVAALAGLPVAENVEAERRSSEQIRWEGREADPLANPFTQKTA